ncbi:U-box domain-containing protein 21 [Hordeum vulgare]|nr:U-box domain-containing protein 21 [Hordeum vulgare]
MEVLVKKMFRVSDMAPEFASRPADTDAGTCCDEVPRVGALQKLLLLLQVGCDGVIKDRDSDLLKLLNGFRGSVRCMCI